ncbi:MAG: tRNA guanosine(34) transglycosylase Tgt [Chloroflexota bacterium]
MSHFRLLKTDPATGARLGELNTAHGVVATPVFLPVGSQATVKTLTPDELKDAGFNMVLANTYHLYLRPGIEVIEKLGGLHKFMAWDRAILTDSGGYQVFSLAGLNRVSDEGVTFRSHLDGSQHFISPELAIEFQERLGADIIMVLDECPSHLSRQADIEEATARTHLWAERCLKTERRKDQALYAIVQGGLDGRLRRRSAEHLASLDFPGYAIGGLSLGEPKAATWQMLSEAVAALPAEKPRYLMGVGSPEDIIEGILRGCDVFDCALPTRVARNGAFFTRSGRFNISNAGYRLIEEPLEKDCGCYACTRFSAAYIHHLYRARELLALRLLSIHNLSFVGGLVEKARRTIRDGQFGAFAIAFLAGYRPSDEAARLSQKEKWLNSRRQKELP